MHAADFADGLPGSGLDKEFGGEYGPYLTCHYTKAVLDPNSLAAEMCFLMSHLEAVQHRSWGAILELQCDRHRGAARVELPQGRLGNRGGVDASQRPHPIRQVKEHEDGVRKNQLREISLAGWMIALHHRSYRVSRRLAGYSAIQQPIAARNAPGVITMVLRTREADYVTIGRNTGACFSDNGGQRFIFCDVPLAGLRSGQRQGCHL